MQNEEPIIINNIDVSKCIHYKNRSCIANYLLTDQDFSEAKCAYSSNCYFKQLARKTTALEEIEKIVKINCEEICGRKFEACNDTSCFSAEILNIINKVKEN